MGARETRGARPDSEARGGKVTEWLTNGNVGRGAEPPRVAGSASERDAGQMCPGSPSGDLLLPAWGEAAGL